MHLRHIKSTKKGKTYEYAQLVESYRRKNDGKPAVRVIKHLGSLSDSLFKALRIALEADRKGDTLMLRSEVAELLSGSTLANRRYLDLSVLIDCWRQWDLSNLLDELSGDQATSLSLSEVILPLVLQRCCAPRSKLEATRWVPTTALPEVLGLNVTAFHNTRIHRSLENLYGISEELQQQLSNRYSINDAASSVFFMDVTDTYFEGIGCPMAEQTRTKTEMPHKRCLGIVLLANEYGYPLRWKVVGGKTKDWDAMHGMLSDIGQVQWLQETPLVFDRAMGNQKTVAKLKAARTVHFLTAAHVTAIESYTTAIPFSALANVVLENTEKSYEKDIEHVAQAARGVGFEEIHSRLFTIDLGVAVPTSEQETSGQDPLTRRLRGRPVLAATHLRQAYEIRNKMAANSNLDEIATSLDISKRHLMNQLALLQLAPAVQERILQWDDRFPFGEKYLRSLLSLRPNEQLAALDKKLAAAISASQESETSTEDDEPIGLLRLVAYFNPQLFVDIRLRTKGHCEKLQRHVELFNVELAKAKRSRDYDVTYRRFAREVERLNYLDTFDIELTPISISSKTGRSIDSFQGTITRNEKAWRRRRRYDGFVLLLGHPELSHTAKQLVRFYRIKDTVEKDFQTIKSLIKLRPIFSYTDPKVQAHVTLCMLALLIQRTLERRLRTKGLTLTAPTCIDLLSTCHLNQRRSDGAPLYDITQVTAEQQQILSALGLEHVADARYMGNRIIPRHTQMSSNDDTKQTRQTRCKSE